MGKIRNYLKRQTLPWNVANKIIFRQRYMKRLQENMASFGSVKVITGVRKSGKTTLLKQFRDFVTESTDSVALLFEMQSASMDPYLTKEGMIGLVYPQIPEDAVSFLFLDEVNEIEEWHRFINSLMIDRPLCNIFITGSNAFLLSNELSTYLSGKTKEIHVVPFSFNEYLLRYGSDDVQSRFHSFLLRGSLPVADPDASDDDYQSVMDGIYSTVVLKDVMDRSDKTVSSFRLKRILAFILESTGKKLSVNRIATKTKLSNDTIESYLQLLEDAFLVYRVETYSIRGKDLMSTPVKYYVVDNGLRYAALNYRASDMGQLLETAVYFELRRRGYNVYVGDIDGKEIDFIATKGGETEYYQVCWTLASQETMEREVRPLRSVRNHYRKTVITADPLPQSLDDGVECVNVIAWMRDDGLRS